MAHTSSSCKVENEDGAFSTLLEVWPPACEAWRHHAWAHHYAPYKVFASMSWDELISTRMEAIPGGWSIPAGKPDFTFLNTPM